MKSQRSLPHTQSSPDRSSDASAVDGKAVRDATQALYGNRFAAERLHGHGGSGDDDTDDDVEPDRPADDHSPACWLRPDLVCKCPGEGKEATECDRARWITAGA